MASRDFTRDWNATATASRESGWPDETGEIHADLTRWAGEAGQDAHEEIPEELFLDDDEEDAEEIDEDMDDEDEDEDEEDGDDQDEDE